MLTAAPPPVAATNRQARGASWGRTLLRTAVAALLLTPAPSAAAQDSAAAQSTDGRAGRQTPAAAAAGVDLLDLFGTPTGEVPLWISPFLAQNPNWSLDVVDSVITLHSFGVPQRGSVLLPRLAAAVPLIEAEMDGEACEVRLEPLPDTWRIAWEPNAPLDQLDHGLIVTIHCDRPPLTPAQTPPVQPRFDGVIELPAALARTRGQTIRYEPQPHKNTVGFWTSADDAAAWVFRIDRPGEYSLAALAGCGKGQGGSTMAVRIRKTGSAADSPPAAKLEFTVAETGNFQNFRWQPLGLLPIVEPGEYQIEFQPAKIAAKAAVDIRAVQLVRQAGE